MTTLKIGQKCTFHYDRNFLTEDRYKKRDGITVTVHSEPEKAGNSDQIFVWVEFGISNCGLMQVMVQELTAQ